MGKFKLLFFCFLFFSFTGNCYSQEKNNYALLVGIENYKDSNIAGLKTSFKDLKELQKIFKKDFNFKTDFISEKQATKKNIKNKLKSFVKNVGPNDSVIIYWSLKSEIEPLYGYGWWLTYDSVYGDTLTYLDSVEFAKSLALVKGSVLLIINGEAPPGFASGAFENFAMQEKKGVKLLIAGKNTTDFFKPKEKGLSFLGSVLSAFLNQTKTKGFTANELGNYLQKYKSLKFSSLSASHAGNGNIFFVNNPLKSDVGVAEVKKEDTEKKDLKKKRSVVTVNTNPQGCSIYINDKFIGKSPLNKYSIEPGAYLIKAVKKDFEPKSKKVVLKEDLDLAFNFSLKQIPPEKGFLIVKTNYSKSDISFVHLKKSYKPNMALDPGVYEISVKAPFYENTVFSAKIKSSENNIYNIKLKPITSFRNSLNQKFLRVFKGDFQMGSPLSEERRDIDEDLHNVRISQDFFLMDREVTVKEWRTFVKETDYKATSFANSGAEVWIGYTWDKDRDYSYENPGFEQEENEPVTCISYIDVKAFVNWLSKKEGLKYVIPTEAQWEYACRAGSSNDFAYGSCVLDSQANFAANSKRGNCPEGKFIKRTITVKSLEPNKWGFYDMHGNLMEWCCDYYGSYPKTDIVIDPKGPLNGKFKVLRGGGWDTDINNVRAANRFRALPETARNNIGFRLAVEINN